MTQSSVTMKAIHGMLIGGTVLLLFPPMDRIVAGASPQRGTVADATRPSTVSTIADEYVREYTGEFPEAAGLAGLAGADQGRLSDRSTSARRAWEVRQDAWLARLAAVDQSTLLGTPEWVIYGQLREKLESDRLLRVCQRDLWNVNQMNGWQVQLPRVAERQPLGSPAERERALTRWRTFPRYIDVEIANLAEGGRRGYLAPRQIVRLVIDQLDQILSAPVGDSAFFPPAARSGPPELQTAWATLVRETINPAIKRYRDYLANQYTGIAREALGVLANPNGHACYDASFRSYTTLTRSAKETSDLGATRVSQFDAEAKRIAREGFGTDDLEVVARRVNSDTARRFPSRDDHLAFARDAVERGARAIPRLFGRLPQARVAVEPFPAYLERTASAQYRAAPADGSRSAIYQINLYKSEEQLRANAEITAFHETFPGHHLQVGISYELPVGHPVGRLTGNSAFAEGWARYAEGVAEELGLYSEDYARISRRRWPGRGMVVDPGIHLFGWKRDQAVSYMMAGSRTKEEAERLVDRIAVLPAQLTSYDTGGLEFERLREHARSALGARFDVRAFHDQVLSVGLVPFPMLQSIVDAWIAKPR
jgi:uncharacterized protein (DUF885 family)